MNNKTSKLDNLRVWLSTIFDLSDNRRTSRKHKLHMAIIAGLIAGLTFAIFCVTTDRWISIW